MAEPTEFAGGFDFTQAELNDPVAFAAKVEASRLVLVKALAAVPEPINVWTSGQCVLQVRGSYEARCVTCGQPTSTERIAVDA